MENSRAHDPIAAHGPAGESGRGTGRGRTPWLGALPPHRRLKHRRDAATRRRGVDQESRSQGVQLMSSAKAGTAEVRPVPEQAPRPADWLGQVVIGTALETLDHIGLVGTVRNAREVWLAGWVSTNKNLGPQPFCVVRVFVEGRSVLWTLMKPPMTGWRVARCRRARRRFGGYGFRRSGCCSG